MGVIGFSNKMILSLELLKVTQFWRLHDVTVVDHNTAMIPGCGIKYDYTLKHIS